MNDDDDESASSNEDMSRAVIKKAWNQMIEGNDQLLFFGSSKTAGDLSGLHPQPGQILRLWQIYSENVNPLLKLTHIPTMQARIIDVASNVTNIGATIEALMFSIYCVSVMSLAEDECLGLLGTSKKLLLESYQFGCQQALLQCLGMTA